MGHEMRRPVMEEIGAGLGRVAALGGDSNFADPEFMNTDGRQYILAGPDVREALAEEIDESDVFLIPAQVRGGTPMMMSPREPLAYRGLPVMAHGRAGFLSLTYMTADGQEELVLRDPSE